MTFLKGSLKRLSLEVQVIIVPLPHPYMNEVCALPALRRPPVVLVCRAAASCTLLASKFCLLSYRFQQELNPGQPFFSFLLYGRILFCKNGP